MIPIKDQNPTKRTPFVTLLLIGANITAFLLIGAQLRKVIQFGAIPCDVLGQCSAISAQLESEFVGRSPRFSTVTSMFMHGDILHLGGNMLFLWVFGNNIEDTFGRFRYLAFYLAAGVAATLAFAVFNASSEVPLIGASGAVSAVLGAYLWIFPRARITALVPFFLFLPVNVSAKFILVMWFVLQILDGIGGSSSTPEGGGIAILAHIVGFAIGYFVARLTTKRRNAHYSELAT